MNKTDIIFTRNIRKILDEGSTDIDPRARYKSDGAPAHAHYITQVYEEYDISKGEFPLSQLRPIAINNGINEIFWIYQDQSNSLDLLEQKYGIMWWRDWAVEQNELVWTDDQGGYGIELRAGTIGQRYGATVKKYDLMNKLLNGLKENPFGRRHMISLWQESDLQETDGLPPCAFQTLWTPRYVNGEFYLDMTLTQRSSDYLVAGHINKMQYVALQMMVAHEVGMKVGKFAHFVQNLHIYSRHVAQAHELLQRPIAKDHPKLILNAEGKSFYDITLSDFTLENYHPVKPNMKFDLGI